MSRLTDRILIVGGVLSGFLTLILFATPVSAVTAGDWNPGNIMSDSVFFNSSSMNTDGIQWFLNSKMPTCNTWHTRSGSANDSGPPYTCLKNYSENPTTHQNNGSAGGGGGVPGGWSAAQIIKHAADTYGVSPKVLIVLLQKEQSLITDDWPWAIQYRSATGYGCPDTAPCDAEYYGLYNQIMNAASQFKRYANNPGGYRYKAYQNNYIQYNPNASCSGSNVYIANQATAGLYNYTPYQPNASALANLYGNGDSCGAYGNRNFWRMYSDWFGSTQYDEILLSYKSHLSGYGWTSTANNFGLTGTTGQARPMEAFKINGEVEYSSYNNTTGWQPTISKGMISGTTGLSRPIQAIKINPTGNLSSRYDLYYRAHVSQVGWMGWAKNGEIAGVTGDSTKTIEAFEIQLIPKGHSAPGSSNNAYQNVNTISYNPPISLSTSSHVGFVGWQPTVIDNMVTGTTDEGKRIEAIRIALNNNTGQTGGIVYSTHLAGIGWQDIKHDNEISGTVGQSRQVEAIQIALTGTLAENYDVWYRGHVQYIGWMGWAKNGSPAGSVGVGRQLEALEIRVVPKNSMPLPQNNNLYNPLNIPQPDSYSIDYSTHVGSIGWIDGNKQNNIGGTTGLAKTIEALRFNSVRSMGGGDIDLICSSYVTSTGWINNISVGNNCGTVGQAKPLEAIRLNLSGNIANRYDVYYKVHLSRVGWQNWVKNNEQAGSPNSGKPIEAIIVKLVEK